MMLNVGFKPLQKDEIINSYKKDTFKRNYPKMPKALKIVKSGLPKMAIFKMGKDPIGFLLKHQKETGNLYRVDAPIKFVLVSDPEFVKHILQQNWRNYEKGPAYDGFKLILGNGILTSEGETWRRNRKLVQPSFSKENIRSIVKSVNYTSRKWIEKWSDSSGKGTSIEVKQDMFEFTLEVISNSMMGEELTEKYKHEFLPLFLSEYDFVLKRNLSIFKTPMWFPTPANLKFKKAIKRIDEIVFEIISIKKQQPDDSMLSMIMATKDKEGQGLSDHELRDEFMTLFAAGFETTGTSLAWTILLLAKHPDIQQNVYEEISGLDESNMNSIYESPWLNAIINETLRLYPAAWVLSRRCISEDVIDDKIIPKKSTMFISIFNMHRDPKYWDEPEKFKPSRFFNETQNPAYHPYGIGPRKCIGNYFSHMIQLYILYHLISNFEIKLGKDRGFEIDAKISLKPDGDVLVNAISRKS